MMKKVAKTIVFLLWCVCVASIIVTGLSIYAFVQLVGFSEPSADLVYAIWIAGMVYHLCYDMPSSPGSALLYTRLLPWGPPRCGSCWPAVGGHA